MKIGVFDIETDGFLDVTTRVHIMVVKDHTTGKSRRFRADQMREGLSYLDSFDIVAGHNVIKFDLPVLQKLYGYTRHWRTVLDTLVLSRLPWPDLFDGDKERVKKGTMPSNLMGRYSLEAWGYRLGHYKGDFKGPWDVWTQEMEDYCDQDTKVTDELLTKIENENWPSRPLELETQVAYILARQERHGFLFDEKKAVKLYSRLVQRKLELEQELQAVFKPMEVDDGEPFIPKRDNSRYGYKAGVPFQKRKVIEFNPGSRAHIARWLTSLYGWKPTEFTGDGKPKVDEAVISKLPYKEVAPLKEYLMVCKRIGQVAEGDQAWLKQVGPDGRMHGGVNTIGAITGRMTHSHPNMGQVPAGYSPYGHECRELFTVPPGKLLVGCDASALELCDLAGYMATYDGGEYVNVVLKGDKKLGTDIHSMNAKALGLDPKGLYFDGETGRDIAKTWFYAFIYGAGDEKLGLILIRKKGPAAVRRGKEARAAFLANLKGMGLLVNAVKAKAKKQGWLRGLDGRRIQVRSEHAALNTLLQCAGAVQMKVALCILDDSLQSEGLVPGTHYEFVANVHDEFQIEVDHDKAELVGKLAAEAISKAGVALDFKCPLSGEYRVGTNWNETH